MTDRTLSWRLPPVGPRQLPIQATRLEMRVSEEFPWTVLDSVKAEAPQELVLIDVNPGTMYYRAIVIDTGGQESLNPPVISAEGTYDPPSNVLDFTATDSE